MGRSRTARRSNEEPRSKVFFEFLDGPRKWRLFDVYFFSRASEMKLFGNRKKTTQMTKLHTSHFKHEFVELHACDQEGMLFKNSVVGV